jgi:predicted nucleic acid-binding protein
MKIMIDLNVILDYAEKRQPYYRYSSIVISQVLKGKCAEMVPAHALTTINYLVTKHANQQRANEVTDWMLAHFEVAPAEKSSFVRARNLSIGDFEDAVVATLAMISQCDIIVTRNISDFASSPILAVTPEQFVGRYITFEDVEPPSV